MNMVVKGLLVTGMTSLGLLAGLGAVKMQSTQNRPPNGVSSSGGNSLDDFEYDEDAPDAEWEEVKLKNKDEIPRRPGNYEVLGAITDFMQGLHAMRPEARCAFPMLFDGGLVESHDDFNRSLREKEQKLGSEGKQASNKRRGYNYYFTKLAIEEYVDGKLDGNAGMVLRERELERVAIASKHHSGRMYVVRATMDIAHLQRDSRRDDTVSKDNNDIFAVAQTADGWKVVYYDK